MYLNFDRKLYNTLKFKKPGWLACYGMCYKSAMIKITKMHEKFPNIKQGKPEKSEMDSQLGGSLLINNKGKIVYMHIMNFIGDHAKPEDIISALKAYFGRALKPKIFSLYQNNQRDLTPKARELPKGNLKHKNSSNNSDKDDDEGNIKSKKSSKKNGFINFIKSKTGMFSSKTNNIVIDDEVDDNKQNKEKYDEINSNYDSKKSSKEVTDIKDQVISENIAIKDSITTNSSSNRKVLHKDS